MPKVTETSKNHSNQKKWLLIAIVILVIHLYMLFVHERTNLILLSTPKPLPIGHLNSSVQNMVEAPFTPFPKILIKNKRIADIINTTREKHLSSKSR